MQISCTKLKFENGKKLIRIGRMNSVDFSSCNSQEWIDEMKEAISYTFTLAQEISLLGWVSGHLHCKSGIVIFLSYSFPQATVFNNTAT